MTLLELVLGLRTLLYDIPDLPAPSAGFIYSWEEDDSPNLWKNAELVSYLNEAQNELARRQPIRDDARCFLTRIALRPNVTRYSYSDKILAIDDIKLESSGLPLTKVSMADEWNRRVEQGADIAQFTFPDDVNYTPEPFCYSNDTNERVIVVFDKPTVSDFMLLSVRRLPRDALDWAQRTTQIPEFPSHIHDALILWAASIAYRKRDSDTGAPINVDLAGYYQGQFTHSVGPRISFVIEAGRKEVAGKRLRVRTQYY